MATTNYDRAYMMYKKGASGMEEFSNSKAKEGNGKNGVNDNGVLSTVENFFSDDPVNVDENTWKIIEWDCVVSEAHGVANQITKFPIQSGFMVSDHTIRQNRVLQLRGIMVNVALTPKGMDAIIDLAAKAGGAILGTGLGAIIGSAITKAKYLFSDEPKVNKVKNTFNELEALCMNGTFVHVSTILGSYLYCVVRDVKVSQDSKTSSVLIVDLTLEEVQVQNGSDIDGARKALQSGSAQSFKWKKYVQAMGINTAVVLGGMF